MEASASSEMSCPPGSTDSVLTICRSHWTGALAASKNLDNGVGNFGADAIARNEGNGVRFHVRNW